jgi:hypothetical protein
MSYEDKYDAMCDYNAEQQNEGRAEVLAELREYVALQPQKLFTKEDILEIIDVFE